MKYYTEYEFCENYVETMINIINVSEDEKNLIEETRNDELIEASSIADERERTVRIAFINQFYNDQLIDLLSVIQRENPNVFSAGFRRLYDILIRYSVYALRISMKVPTKDINLTIRDYYDNYLKALLNMERIKATERVKPETL